MTHWTVIDRTAGVFSHAYHFNREGTANTFAARMADGRLMVISPGKDTCDEAFDELCSFGDIGALVANNGFHHLGQAQWRQRFPQVRCFAPAEAVRRIQKNNPALGGFEALSEIETLTGPDIGLREVPHSRAGESWCWVRIQGGYVWYVSDVLINLDQLPSALLPRLMFQLSKSAPGFRIFHLAMAFIARNKKATLKLLRDDMDRYPPTVIVPAHGRILTEPDLAARTRALIDAAL